MKLKNWFDNFINAYKKKNSIANERYWIQLS